MLVDDATRIMNVSALIKLEVLFSVIRFPSPKYMRKKLNKH